MGIAGCLGNSIPRVVFRSRSGDRDRGENCSTTCKRICEYVIRFRTLVLTASTLASTRDCLYLVKNVARCLSAVRPCPVATKGTSTRGVSASHNFYMPICGKHQVPRTLSAEAHANAMSFSSQILISRQLFVLHESRHAESSFVNPPHHERPDVYAIDDLGG